MRIYSLQDLPEDEHQGAGGKARGLALLARAGLETPEGFVLIGIQDDGDLEAAAACYEKSGLGAVAVRSSAAAEDGFDFSSAGQYETVLNVRGRDGFVAAVRRCLDSLHGEAAGRYAAFFAGAKSGAMSVVVQRMVDAAWAGVCFTKDPSAPPEAAEERRLVIEAVKGLGESLVSGMSRAASWSVPVIDGAPALEAAVGAAPDSGAEAGAGLDKAALSGIASGALRALEAFGCELDMEWAIDADGKLFWLQARPITVLSRDAAAVDEFDDKSAGDSAVFTTCNVGEMLPGAVTPLSLTVVFRSIENGIRKMLVVSGVYKDMDAVPPGSCLTPFSNHMFFNLTTIYKIAAAIFGAQKDSVERSICGRILENTPPLPWKDMNPFVKSVNAVKYFRFLFSWKRAMKEMEEACERFSIPQAKGAAAMYANIGAAQKTLDQITYFHYITSAHSGAMSSTLLIIILKETGSEEEARAVLSAMLEGIGGIESADILRSLRRLAAHILRRRPDAASFSADQLAAFIQASSGEARALYDGFLARHGHRTIREAELRSKSWQNDEHALMENLSAVLKSGAEPAPQRESQARDAIERFLSGKNPLARRALSFVIDQARQGAYNREYTKSLFIRAVEVFKTAYARLAEMLVEAGALPDTDLIYFLTHEEIGGLIVERRAHLVKKALQRRRLLDEQMARQFNDVYVGRPVPVTQTECACAKGGVLMGLPVSRGEARGFARVVKTVSDARALKGGEIMVAAFTDIGWSPFYSAIKGLVTEVGSALSHGAVVAREYALPLVANVHNATALIKTGDYISMNGATGEVRILEKAQAAQDEVLVASA